MKNHDEDQSLSDADLENLANELQKKSLDERMLAANIAIKEASGYLEAVSMNAHIDRWRASNSDGYRKQRRAANEAKAKKEGRNLRDYEPSTPERRREQLRASKQKARLDPTYAEAERARNAKAKADERAAMTDEERAEANRIRREKRAAKATPTGSAGL